MNIKKLVLILLSIFVISSGITFSLSRITDFEGRGRRWNNQYVRAFGSVDRNDADNNISLSRKFPAQNIREIRIQTVFEDVQIIESSNNIIYLYYYGKTSPPYTAEEILEVSLQENGRLLNVKSEWSKRLPAEKTALQLDIKIPADLLESADIDVVSGDVMISRFDLKDSLSINTVSGDVEIDNFSAGNTNLSTVSGDVETTKLATGAIEVKTISGDVDMELFVNGEFSATSKSGDLNVNSAILKENMNLETLSGDIKLTLPSKQSFNLAARTKSGRIRNTYSPQDNADSKSVNKPIGDGGPPEIRLNTLSGKITLKRGR